MTRMLRGFFVTGVLVVIFRQWTLLDISAANTYYSFGPPPPSMCYSNKSGPLILAQNNKLPPNASVSSPKDDEIDVRQSRAVNTTTHTMFALHKSFKHVVTVSPVKDVLKIYVYDNLPDEFDADIRRFLVRYYLNTSINSETDCKAELALVELFRSFPGRTLDHREADIFVVPYPHASHCFMNPPGQIGCRQIGSNVIENLLASLPHYQARKSRHLFLLGYEIGLLNKQLSQQDLILTSGPRDADHSQPGTILIPLFHDGPMFQPSVIASRSLDWWTARPRKYAFAYYYGESNSNTRTKFNGRRFRKYFRLDMEREMQQQQLGGMAFRLQRLDAADSDWKMSGSEAIESYAESIFCPILAGDAPWQRRFFDAILSGCLPVVLSWTTPSYPGGKSWFQPEYKVYGTKKKNKSNRRKTYSVQQAYPFAEGLFDDDHHQSITIDYETFVVECPGNQDNESDVSSLRLIMEDMLLHHQDEIRRRQLALQQVALAFSYGLGDDAHRYDDAFARIIRTLKSRLPLMN